MLMAAAPAALATTPTNSGPPDVDRASGSRTITTDNGTWLVFPLSQPDGYTYAWFRCTSTSEGSCAQVPGASGTSYVLRTADIGFRIRSRVTAFHDGDPSTPEFSNAEGPITAAPPVNTARPVVTGIAREDFALGTTTGTWSGRVAGDPPFRYQWQRCTPSVCSAIPGSVSTTRLLGKSDLGLFIRSVISAEGLGLSAAVPSNLAGPVQAGPPGPDAPPEGGGSATRLSPFPVVVIAGRLRGRRTRISDFVVRGPRRAKVSVRCKGRRCPFRRIRGTIGKRKRLRIRRAQRTYRPGQVLEIRITGRNRIGKFTRVTFRRARAPRRVDSCLNPGATKPRSCAGA